ncbi:hypothetical protein EYR41_006099 [Orbilia oligospora]|uniref:Uncharacterized protein n=1 Tax=Orbilia oligospora TaxID=2813651 RepID=A0A8H2E2A5_ORBOL|nr:hypothetical protein EYR41_006099 [Orbilia oligospora]
MHCLIHETLGRPENPPSPFFPSRFTRSIRKPVFYSTTMACVNYPPCEVHSMQRFFDVPQPEILPSLYPGLETYRLQESARCLCLCSYCAPIDGGMPARGAPSYGEIHLEVYGLGLGLQTSVPQLVQEHSSEFDAPLAPLESIPQIKPSDNSPKPKTRNRKKLPRRRYKAGESIEWMHPENRLIFHLRNTHNYSWQQVVLAMEKLGHGELKIPCIQMRFQRNHGWAKEDEIPSSIGRLLICPECPPGSAIQWAHL